MGSLAAMPSFAPSNGSSMCFIISTQPEDSDTRCRECKKSIFEGDLRLGKGSWQWVKDEQGNPHRGTWRCFATCVDDTLLTDVLRSQDGEAFDPEQLEGYVGLDMDEKKTVKERLDHAASNKEEVDAAQKLARAERKKQEAEEVAEAAAKKAEKLAAKRAAAKAAKKGHLAVSTKGSNLVPCAKCGEHINKNFASMHECKKSKAPSAISFFGAAATKSKAAELAAAAGDAEMTDATSTKRKDHEATDDAPKKKKKKVKEDGQPKGALSAYFFFTASVRDEVTRANPDKKVTELATVFGDMWKKLSDEEKAPFVAEADADKARYSAEMEEFNKPEAKAERAEAAASKAAAEQTAKEAKAEAAKAAKAAKQSAKPKAAPKKKAKEIRKPVPIVYVDIQCGCSVRQGWEWAHECKKPAALPAKTPLRDLFNDAKSPPADAASPPEATSVTSQ